MAIDDRFRRQIHIEPEANATLIKISFDGGARTDLRVRHGSSGIDIVNTDTFPYGKRGQSYGSEALKAVKRWAKNKGLKSIRVRDMSEGSESFWHKNGFVPTETRKADAVCEL